MRGQALLWEEELRGAVSVRAVHGCEQHARGAQQLEQRPRIRLLGALHRIDAVGQRAGELTGGEQSPWSSMPNLQHATSSQLVRWQAAQTTGRAERLDRNRPEKEFR